MVSGIEIKRLFEVCVRLVDLTCLHAGSCSVDVVLGIVLEEIYRSAKLNLRTLVVLLVEALCSKGIVSQRETSFYERWLSAKIKSVMVVTESKIEALKFTICIASIQMDSTICRHEVQCLIEDSQCFLRSTFFVQGSSHVIVSKANLHRDFFLKLLCVHELRRSLKITESLIVIISLSVDTCTKK